jgi:GNAT superfamily N-acetyltransferase
VDKKSPTGKVIHTAVNNRLDHYGGTACIFCLLDGKCALQVAAVANGLHPWRFKPYYCIIHPLDLDDRGRITLDRTPEMVAETGSCLRPAADPIPLVDTFSPELRYLLGQKGYSQLVKLSKKSTLDDPETPSKFVLRPVTDADRENVKELITRDWGAPEIVVNERVYTPHTLPGMFALLDGTTAGLITWEITGLQCEIVSLNAYVPGKGVGSALLQAVETLAVENGCRVCRLVTTNDNLPAVHFYQQHGYRVVEIRRNAVDRAREKKPSIPLVAENGIPISDELVLEKGL